MDFSQAFWAPANWLLANAPEFLTAIIILALGWFLSQLAANSIRALLPRAQGIDRNFGPLLAQAAHYGIIIVAVVTALGFLGVSSASILAVLGAMGLAIALALQNTLANIAAGIMLLWLRPVAIGEYVQGDGVAGVVVEIGLFGTRLRSSSGLYVFTPNQKLWASAITNHSREPQRRIDVNVTIPETMSIAAARRLLLAIARADKRVLPDPEPLVVVAGFAGTTVNIQLRAWVATPNYLPALYALTEDAKLGLDRALSHDSEGKGQVTVAPDPTTPNPETKMGA